MTIEVAEARLCLRAGAPARRPQLRDRTDQHRLRGRGGRARLHRAHQHPRQHAHARLRHPPRVRYRGRRRLQPRAGRPRRAAAEEPRTTSRPSRSPTSRARRRTASIVNVDVEEQSTGEFSVAGGYSTADGFIAEVSVGERNLLGRGQYRARRGQYGQRTRGIEFSFVEPYLLDYRLAFGIDLFAKQIDRVVLRTSTDRRRSAAGCARRSAARGSRVADCAIRSIGRRSTSTRSLQQL